MKSKYITPEITVVEFKVESGFAASGDLQLNSEGTAFNMQGQGDGGFQATQMSEGTDYTSYF